MPSSNMRVTRKRANAHPPRKQKGDQLGSITNSSGGARNSMRKLTKVSIPLGLQFFPDVYDCWAKTCVLVNLTGSGASSASFHLNSPAYTFGPQINYTGGFGVNVPAGMNMLMSSDNISGASAPYFYSRTVECIMDCDVVNSATTPVSTAFLPTTSGNLSATSFESIIEQRGAVWCSQPASSTIVSRMQNHVKFDEVYGINKRTLYNDVDHRQNTGALPSYSLYGHFVTAAMNGTSSVATEIQITFRLHIQFTQRNNFTATQPALLRSEPSINTREDYINISSALSKEESTSSKSSIVGFNKPHITV